MSSKPHTVHDMAYRRGLTIAKAKHGGWYVTLTGAPWAGVLYASHDWKKIMGYVKKRAILLKRKETGPQ
jgi:hypothetical protein